jgi:hypothetical protein
MVRLNIPLPVSRRANIAANRIKNQACDLPRATNRAINLNDDDFPRELFSAAAQNEREAEDEFGFHVCLILS